MPNVSEDIRKLIIDHHLSNMSTRAIARAVNRPQSTVADIVKRFTRTGLFTHGQRGRCGRPRLLSQRTERLIVRASVINPKATAREIQSDVQGSSLSVSSGTVKRTLRRNNRVSYRPVKAPSLNANQKRVRLQWCRSHESWTEENWKKVILFDIFIKKSTYYAILFFPFRFFSLMRLILMLVT